MFQFGQNYAVKYMNAFVAIAKRVDSNYAINLVYNLGVMGQDYPDELIKHRDYIESKNHEYSTCMTFDARMKS